MSKVKEIFKGLFIGLAAILPGISGSMIATIFNVYDKLVNALNIFPKRPIYAIKLVWEYVVGVLLGVIMGVYIITTIFNAIPIPISLFFIGLILGAIPKIFGLAQITKKNYKGIIIVLVSFVIMLLFNLIPDIELVSFNGDLSVLMWMVVGFLMALALITPGFSIATLLLLIGGYFPLLALLKEFINSLITFNGNALLKTILPVFLVFIVLLISLVMLAKIINKLIVNYKTKFYQVVLGLSLAAPFNILIELNEELLKGDTPINIFRFDIHWFSWLIGILIIPLAIIIMNGMFFSKTLNGERIDETNL